MQLSAVRYKRKRIPKATVPVTKALVLSILQKLPKITAKSQKDNNKAASIYITAWMEKVMVMITLVDKGTMVDLVSSRVIKQLPHIKVYKDNPTRNVLANETRVNLTEYVILPVNVAGVVATTRAHIVPSVKRYRILLGLKWLCQVQMTINYGTNQITIQGTNGHPQEVTRREVPAKVRKYLPRQEETLDSGYEAEAKDITNIDKALQCIIEGDNIMTRRRETGSANGFATEQSAQMRKTPEHGSSNRP